MSPLPPAFLARPIAHRALHDRGAGRPENGLSAVRAAIAGGYGIEIDLQPSGDGVPMVFHDATLDRLTAERGPIADRPAAELSRLSLLGSDDTIPTLARVLEEVAGRVPLLIEVKDQDGALGPDVGALEEATAAALRGYEGPVALMSFNPESVAALAVAAPDIPRGLTTCAFDPADWPGVPPGRLAILRDMTDTLRTGASFISHDHRDLARARVSDLAGNGLAILCWTVRSPEEETAARRHAHTITFEGYTPQGGGAALDRPPPRANS
ncbi:glycerophosphodiester phosphodiesterase family protein [Histidinibacterium lentulum]|uniref:Phosphodiesterase n=1 Tax=Histidinibacterium lentulum TaxID=2480588 RepID=A0A3N2R0M9_9RHOB|nr:glycerophosphodiester phosphodiesterase family protein [Histidinibacterium lentulum]ROU01025.1 phosphodiesterase [Histidinibacterium lentulum]